MLLKILENSNTVPLVNMFKDIIDTNTADLLSTC